MMLLHVVILCPLFTLIQSPYDMARNDKDGEVIKVLAKLRNVETEDVLSEAKIIRNDVEDEKCSRKANFCKTLKNLGKSGLKDLLIALVVVTMSHMSGVSLITTYLVDIFSSTGISEIVLVLVTGLSEMLFSSFQVIIADKLGR